MHWFIANAPIRKKLLVSFGSMVGLVGLTPLTLLLMPRFALAAGVLATLVAAVLGVWYRHAIATPYVTTVVRMEALAAGDLASPIQFTDYRDCVGRLTKAMFSFRDTAAAQIRQNEEAEQLAQRSAPDRARSPRRRRIWRAGPRRMPRASSRLRPRSPRWTSA